MSTPLSNGFSLLLAATMLAAVGCAEDTDDTAGLEVESIAPTYFRYLQGTFDSADQAAEDANYYAIELKMCQVDAPNMGEMVLYVEHAMGDDPYRQRIYVIEEGDEPGAQARSVIYELLYPSSWTGFCEGDALTSGAITDDYVAKLEGCDVNVEWDGSSFAGSTFEDACISDWAGASYATSEVTLSEDRLESWDRGWDAGDNYVWGATDGPYVFIRRTDLVSE